MKTETKIILGMMAGSGVFTFTTNKSETDFELFGFFEDRLMDSQGYEYFSDTCTIHAHKSIKPLFSFNYLLSLLSSGILPEVIAEKLEQDGIKIEWV